MYLCSTSFGFEGVPVGPHIREFAFIFHGHIVNPKP